MVDWDPDDWRRVGAAVRDRREALGIRQGDSGPSVATWRKVEGGVGPPYARRTLRAITTALGWTPDSVERILDGGEPVEDRPPPRPERTLEERFDRLEDEVRWLVARRRELEDEIAQLRAERDR